MFTLLHHSQAFMTQVMNEQEILQQSRDLSGIAHKKLEHSFYTCPLLQQLSVECLLWSSGHSAYFSQCLVHSLRILPGWFIVLTLLISAETFLHLVSDVPNYSGWHSLIANTSTVSQMPGAILSLNPYNNKQMWYVYCDYSRFTDEETEA